MRRLGVVWGALALIVVLITTPVIAADQESYYLGPDGVPHGQLLLNPRGGEMPNYDWGRDVEPGLNLERSDRGLEEDDETRFQHWQIEPGEQLIAGYPTLKIWSAADRFEPGRRGVFTAFLLDCNTSGADCDELGSVVTTVDSAPGNTWVESTIDFPSIDHRFDQGRHLGIRIVVSAASETDLIFAYGHTAQRSRLTIQSEPPVRPIETTVVTQPSPSEEIATFAAPVVSQIPAPADDVTMAVDSVWPWLITLVLSTLMLVVLGALLMSSLTKPGRHERLLAGEHLSGSPPTSRLSVPAP